MSLSVLDYDTIGHAVEVSREPSPPCPQCAHTLGWHTAQIANGIDPSLPGLYVLYTCMGPNTGLQRSTQGGRCQCLYSVALTHREAS